MAGSCAKMNYDSKEDIFSLSKNKKVKASIDLGDYIIDIDHKGFVAGIEILNASTNLRLKSEELTEIKKGAMLVTYKPKQVYISLVLKYKQKVKDITIPLAVDLGHRNVTTKRTQFAI